MRDYADFERARVRLAIDDFQNGRISDAQFSARLVACGFSPPAVKATVEQYQSEIQLRGWAARQQEGVPSCG